MPAQNLPGLALDYSHPLTRGLVGWWPMNEGGGIRASDISGNGYHTTGTTTIPTWSGGPNGRAMAFDWTLTARLTFPDMRSKLATDGTFTVWVKRALVPVLGIGDEGGWYFDTAAFDTHYPYGAGGDPIYTGTLSNARKTIGTGALSAAELMRWHLVTITSKPGAGGWVFYQNAQQVYSTTGDATVSIPAAPTLGKSKNTWYLNGGFCNLRLYNRALAAAEVAQLYAEPLAGALAPTNPRRYYTVPVASPPAAATGPLSSDRLYNRSLSRVFRRGETG